MASLNSLMDFTKICRLCLSENCPLSKIFSDEHLNSLLSSLATKILACVAIEVEPGDSLPDKICNRCIDQLENWIKFKELCDNANTLLLQCAASMPPLSDEVLKQNLQGSNSENLDLPDTSADFSFVDVSLLEHDSLFKKFDDSSCENLPNTESLVESSFSIVLNTKCEQLNHILDNEGELQKQAEEQTIKEANKCKWKEKYFRNYRKKYTCGLCPRIFTKFSSLLQHDQVDHKETVARDICLSCGKLFISKLRLEIHFDMKHKEKVYECDVCGLKSVSEKSLKTHKIRHSERFVCTICGAVSSTERGHQDHLRVHTDDRSYSCEICRRTFKQRQSLEHHIKTHLPQKPDHKCNICSREFKTLDYLKKHKISSHDAENFSVCDICGAVLKNKTTLHIHSLSHKEKQHMCVVCDRVFSTKNLLTRHMLIHEARPFVCTICDKSFNRADTLTMHVKTHGATQPYCCNQCGQWFTLNKYLKRHIARIHNKEDEAGEES